MLRVVLFASKGYDSKDEIKFSSVIGNYTPVGVMSIAAVLRNAGNEVKILDAAVKFKKENKAIVKEICRFKPDYVGFSTLTYNFNDAYYVCCMVKKENPNVKAVFGGVHVSLHKEKLLMDFENIDYLIVGDGEYAFRDIIRRGSGENIPGVFYVKDGEIHGKEQTNEDLCDLDDLPFPAYDLLPNFPKHTKPFPFTYPKKPAANLVTSRGCPFKCSFCYNATANKKVRFNSAKYVVDLIQCLHEDFGVKHFDFFDDLFTLDKKRIMDFCREIEVRNLKISFNCFLRSDFDRKMVLALKRAGLYVAYFGIESFSEEILNAHKDGVSVKTLKSDLMFLYENEIWTQGLFIVGLPGETQKSLQETVDTIKQMPIKISSVMRFMPYYGTPIFEELPHLGEFLEDVNDWRNFNAEKFIFLPKTIENKEILEKYLKEIQRAHTKSPYYKKISKKNGKKDLDSLFDILKYSRYILKELLKKS